MPATEKTWYDQKLLHVVFGMSALVMLLATVWMFAADHDREWKGYQRNFREAEQRLTTWRMGAEESERQSDHQRLLDELVQAQVQPPRDDWFAEFKSEVQTEAEQREAPVFGFSRLDDFFAKIGEAAALAQEALAAKSQAVAQLSAAEEGVAAAQSQLAASLNMEERRAGESAVQDAEQQVATSTEEAEEAAENAEDSVAKVTAARERYWDGLGVIFKRARDRETELLSRRKFRSADYDAARADLDLLVRDNRTADMPAAQSVIDEIKVDLDALTLERQAATAHRERLQGILAKMTSDVDRIQVQIGENQGELNRLAGAFDERQVTYFTSSPPFLGKKWLELPVLDAFNSPLKIDNLWTDGLMISQGSFGEVRRFDRCTTCHKGIATSQPGTASDPAYAPAHELELIVQAPDARPALDDGLDALEQVYGFRLADRGLVQASDVTVNYIVAGGVAAKAPSADDPDGSGLRVGDVILAINGDKVLSPDDVAQLMIEGATWGQPISVTIRRGFPQPYTSHPRLDLFVGSLSPHTMADIGCTSCHEGQGSATAFGFASHTPNSPAEAEEWARKHGWFNNHHWIFPMYPERFIESACLKCHHQVTELEPSERFPDPPAPKLVEGFHLVEDYGCYGCHEINGYDGPDRRVGPDLRLEPNFFAAAAAVKADPKFGDLPLKTQQLAKTLVDHPDRDNVRRQLQEFLEADAVSEEPVLTNASHKMVEVLQKVETPGQLRKAGPGLRYVKSKLGETFLYDWIRQPSNFRPSTRMPQFFGLWDHLDENGKNMAERFERVEVYSMVQYLLDRSQPYEYLEREEGTEEPSAERGKVAFEIRGCLACHQHEDFPAAVNLQGPNLSGVGDKLTAAVGAPNGKEWLYSWIKQPTHYHPRTKMPNLYLDPEQDAQGNLVDPAADIVEYLMGSTSDWQPSDETAIGLRPDAQVVSDLTFDYLVSAFPQRTAEKYLVDGIPAADAPSLKGAEIELVGSSGPHQKLMYLGRKTIAKYGCYGCHDIPGFENAKPIGTAMAEWGRKESSKLAFEHIMEYLHHGHGEKHGAGDRAEGGHVAETNEHDAGGHAATAMLRRDGKSIYDIGNPDADEIAYFEQQIASHDRSGFIWQKLREPRSYDYEKTRNKPYKDRLKMPLFPINPHQREAIITFVLGLVSDPPAEQFVYQADPRRNAIVEGSAVIEKYNCAGCHMLEAEKWTLEYEAGEFGTPPEVPDYPFLAAHLSAEQLAKSESPDRYRQVIETTVSGVPQLNNDDGRPLVLDEDEDPVEEDEEYDPDTLLYPFELWEPVAIDGATYQVGVKPLTVPARNLKRRRPAHGGDFARLLLPRVLELEKQDNPAANGTEAWGWVPPPLIGEGKKVQPSWLHDFLLNPYPLRPAVFLRMPKFNMSPEEATKLVNYFAARDNVDYPFEFNGRSTASYLAAEDERFQANGGEEDRLDHAMKIVTNGNYCIKCHPIGDHVPEGSIRAQAPNLTYAEKRLRPDYVRNWIANPKKILPYTSMPVNLPFDPSNEHLGGVAQDLYPGTSIDQVDSLVDLLMNYGSFMSQKNSVSDLVKAAAVSAPADATGEAAEDAQGAASTETDEELEKVSVR